MPTKRPQRRTATVAETASRTLMGNQDLQHKGDSTNSRKKDKCITFWVTDEQKAEISAYAVEYAATQISRLADGLASCITEKAGSGPAARRDEPAD